MAFLLRLILFAVGSLMALIVVACVTYLASGGPGLQVPVTGLVIGVCGLAVAVFAWQLTARLR